MTLCFFATDLHGNTSRYQRLFHAVLDERPDAVFLGGDILPSASRTVSSLSHGHTDFVRGYLEKHLGHLRQELRKAYPRFFLILGNDDSRSTEASIVDSADRGFWEYVHNRKGHFGDYPVFGYSYVPPTPFLLKDWEKYDVSHYLDPGSVSPEEGMRTVPVEDDFLKYKTIQKDLDHLAGNENLEKAIFLFHSPPYMTKLDRAALDGKMIDHVPLDVHVGSIAIRRFIEKRQPLLTLHGHVHESARLSDAWRDRIGNTHLFSAAHEGPQLALVRFDPDRLEEATRTLL